MFKVDYSAKYWVEMPAGIIRHIKVCRLSQALPHVATAIYTRNDRKIYYYPVSDTQLYEFIGIGATGYPLMVPSAKRELPSPMTDAAMVVTCKHEAIAIASYDQYMCTVSYGKDMTCFCDPSSTRPGD